MGIVNDYINKIIKKVNDIKFNKDKPWLKYYDRMPEHIEYFNGSMYDLVAETARTYPNNYAYEYFDTTKKYKNFIESIDKIAIALKQIDVIENECVTICMPNMPESIELVYAINKIGAIANVIHPLSSIDEIKRAMDECNSTTLFTTDASYEKIKDLKVKDLIVVEVSNSFPELLKLLYNIKNSKNMHYQDNVTRWSDFMKIESYNIDTHVNRGKDAPAVIIYSGGTTGKSKGIILSNLCFNSIGQQCKVICPEARSGNSILSALPIFHGFGLCVCIHAPLVLGMKCILIPKIEVHKLAKIIKKKEPTLLPVIPTMLGILMKNYCGPKDLKSVQVILSGGDYLPPEMHKEIENFFKEHGSTAHIQIGYGLSEATAFVSATNSSIRETGNIGIPNPDNIIKIFEPYTDVEKEYGEIGEICINGPSVMLGYINEDKETENILKMHYDKKMWLHTGDLGYMDKDGIIHYSSRLKRMIISNGYNIYPLELEEIINKHKYVDSSVVVGIKDPIKFEVPKAVIVLKKDIEPTKEVMKEIKDYCKLKIAKYAQPKEFEFRESLPLTKIGKIDYKKFVK